MIICAVGFVPPKKGAPVLAYAPHCPVPREERWYVVLADAANNVTLSWNSVALSEAECMGIAEATTSGRQGTLFCMKIWKEAYTSISKQIECGIMFSKTLLINGGSAIWVLTAKTHAHNANKAIQWK